MAPLPARPPGVEVFRRVYDVIGLGFIYAGTYKSRLPSLPNTRTGLRSTWRFVLPVCTP